MGADHLLVIGAGGHAKACLDVIESEGRYSVVGLVGTPTERGQRVLGYEVVGSDDELALMRAGCATAFVGIGQIKSAEPRIRAFDRLSDIGFELATIISPRAHVSRHAQLGTGTIVMHGAIVNAGAVVGDNCIVNSRALVEHDAIIADHCHISTGAIINGGATVGLATFIGSGSTVRERVSVGERSLIGMGQQVLRDCAPLTRMPHVAVQ